MRFAAFQAHMQKFLRLTYRVSTALAAEQNPSADLSQHPALARRHRILMRSHSDEPQFSEEADAGGTGDAEEERVILGAVHQYLTEDGMGQLASQITRQLLPAALVLAAGRLANKVSP